MSENLVATLLTIIILAAILAWVPMLNLICPPCSRFLQRRRRHLPVGRQTVYTSSNKAA